MKNKRRALYAGLSKEQKHIIKKAVKRGASLTDPVFNMLEPGGKAALRAIYKEKSREIAKQKRESADQWESGEMAILLEALKRL